MPSPLGTKEQQEELRHECEVGSDMTLAQAKEALHSALDGLDIAQDREEHMGSDKIHGAYCLNCLELSRRWQAWKEEP